MACCAALTRRILEYSPSSFLWKLMFQCDKKVLDRVEVGERSEV